MLPIIMAVAVTVAVVFAAEHFKSRKRNDQSVLKPEDKPLK